MPSDVPEIIQTAAGDEVPQQKSRKKRLRENKRRIPCPVDPSHDCYAVDLEHHLNRCPSRQHLKKLEAKPFTRQNVNAGFSHSAAPEFQHLQHEQPLDGTQARVAHSYELGVSGMQTLIAKVKQITAEVGLDEEPPVQQLLPDECAKIMCEETERALNVPLNQKHALQFASIIGHMKRSGLLDDATKTTFAELGAGKAYLALMIARATEACNFIINDNRTFKLKADRILRRFIRENVKHTSFVRCQADLNSFVIDGALQELESTAQAGSVAAKTPWRVVGVGKHLCGAATDFALRSLLSYSAEHNKSGMEPSEKGLMGICIAPCCHHRCTWEAYVGKDVLMELGLTQREIELAFWMAGWSLCGHEQMELPDVKELEQGGSTDAGGQTSAASPEGLSLRDRVSVGLRCKRLIEYGRLKWVERQKDCALREVVPYVDSSVSGENRLIVVKFK